MNKNYDIFGPQDLEESENKQEAQEIEKLEKQIINNKKEIGDLIEINKHIPNLNIKWRPHQAIYENTAAMVAKFYWIENNTAYKAEINTDELFSAPDNERTVSLMEERHNKVFNLLKKLYIDREIIRPKSSAELDILKGIDNYQIANQIEKRTE